MKILILVLLYIGVCVGSKVLVVFPVPGKSHGHLGSSVVKILLDAGHEVTYISPFPPETTAPNLKYVDISSVTSVLSGQKKLNIAELARAPHPVHHVQQVGPVFAQNTLEHPEVKSLLLQTNITFDVVLVEWFFSGLLAPLAEVYDCPLIWYRAGDLCWQSLRMVHEASSPTYSRDMHLDHMPALPLSLSDRIYQTWIQFYITGWMYFMKYWVEIPAYEELYREPLRIRGKSLPDFDELAYNASLMFSNSHPPIGQRLALPQSVKYIGGHHIQHTELSITKDVRSILDESKNGVIFFSLGSMLKGKDLPDSMKRPIIDIFSQLNQTVIWKLEEDIRDLPKNIHLVEWAPQQAILNHSNTVLFISHGGLLSVVESTHFGVPVIGVPVFGDQFSNVNLAVQRGACIRIDFTEDFPDRLRDAIDEILGNQSYRENAKTASFVFQRRLVSPQKELNHWVQLVMDTKGAAHLRSPALLVSAPDRLYIDFLFLFFLMLYFLKRVLKVIHIHFSSYDDKEKKNN